MALPFQGVTKCGARLLLIEMLFFLSIKKGLLGLSNGLNKGYNYYDVFK